MDPRIGCHQHQYQFTQNNQQCTAFSELIQRAANHNHFRFESSAPHPSSHVFDTSAKSRFLNFHHRPYSPADMGCIQSIAKSKVSPGKYHGIIVDDIQATIDRSPTEIEEKSPIVLRYRTPYFRASASVIVPPIPKDETWTVGWIQACDSMKFVNQYGKLGKYVYTIYSSIL